LDCDAAALFQYPDTFSEAYGGGDTEYLDDEARTAYRTKCEEAQGLLERSNDRAKWLDDPTSKFVWSDLAKFNCILAEARWPHEYHQEFVEGRDADRCHCLYDAAAGCAEDETFVPGTGLGEDEANEEGH